MSYLNLKGIADKVNKLEAKSNFNLLEIDIEKLVPSNNNFYGIREIEKLAESIKLQGLIHNLLVRKLDDGNYEIISGHRRYYALLDVVYDDDLDQEKKAKFKRVPCHVRDLNDIDSEISLIQANVQQRELSHMEKMKGIERLAELYKTKKANGEEVPKGKTRDIIGKDIGLSGVQVGRYMKVSEKLIEPLKDKLEDGSITLTQATTLSSLKEGEQSSIYKHIESINPKESKQEVDILIDGIKQPVENKKDIELLENIEKPIQNKVIKEKAESEKVEEAKEPKEDDAFEALKELLNSNNNFKTVISTSLIEAVLATRLTQLEGKELKLKVSGYLPHSLRVIIEEVTKVDKIKLIDSELNPKTAFKVADGVYLWFNILT